MPEGSDFWACVRPPPPPSVAPFGRPLERSFFHGSTVPDPPSTFPAMFLDQQSSGKGVIGLVGDGSKMKALQPS